MIKKYPYKSHKEFLELRRHLQGRDTNDQYRIGGSNIATIYSNGDKIGANEYASPTVFFFSECGFHVREDIQSLPMSRGNVQEPVIFENYWKLTDPEHPVPEAWLNNFHGEKIEYRTAKKANAIYVNDKYPWIAVSPDYIFPMSKYNPRGVLELKSPTSRAIEKWEAGTPVAYVVQTYAQMLVLGLGYGELFQVVDATEPQLFQFHENKGIEKNIIDSSKDFVERVLAGKKIVYGIGTELQKEQALAKLAPVDDGSPFYTQFLKERHKPENAKATVPGTGEQLELVLKYLRQKAKIGVADRSLLRKENIIRGWFSGGIGSIDFGDLGKIGWVDKLSVNKNILKKYNLNEDPT